MFPLKGSKPPIPLAGIFHFHGSMTLEINRGILSYYPKPKSNQPNGTTEHLPQDAWDGTGPAPEVARRLSDLQSLGFGV